MHQLQTFGALDLRGPDGRAVDALLQQPRRMALLAFLAAHRPGVLVRRDRLLLLFWPDLEDGRGRAALSQALHVIRRALGAEALVARGTEEVGLDPAHLAADVTRFLEAAAAQDWTGMELAYTGDFLPGFHLGDAPEFGQWLAETRTALRREACQAASRLAEAAAAGGDPAAAVAWSRRALGHDPLDEALVRDLLARLGALGDRTGAARAYEEFAGRLSRELELEPSPETRQLRDAILDADLPPAFLPGVSGHRAAPPQAAPAAAPPAPPVRRRRWLPPLLLAGCAALGILFWRPWVRPAVAGPERVLVLPFAILGDSSLAYLHEGMVDLLGSRLEAFGVLHVVDPAQLLTHLAAEDSSGAVPTPKPALARALAERFQAQMYLTGTVVRLGSGIEISVALHDRDGERRATVTRSAASESDLGGAVNAIARELLGRRWSRPAERLLRVAALETESPEALRAYLAGERAFRQGNYGEARAQFALATEVDTLFALAWYRWSVAGGWLGDSVAYDRGAERAVALAGRLGDRDARLMRAHLAYVRGEVDRAEGYYRDIVAQYPDDAEAWYNLGELLFHWNPRRGRGMDESVEPFARATAIMGPQAESASHLVLLRLLGGERATLLPAMDSLVALTPANSPRRVTYTVLRAIASGEREDMADALEGIASHDAAESIIAAWAVSNYTDRFTLLDSLLDPLTGPAGQRPTRAGALGLLAHAAVGRGDWPLARRRLDQLSALDHATALETRAWLLGQPWVTASREERLAARAALGAAREEPYPPGVIHFAPVAQQQRLLRTFLGGLLALRVGDTSAVEAAVAVLEAAPEAHGGPGLALSLGVELALARGQPETALAELERLDRNRVRLPPDMPQHGVVRLRLLRGEALARAGRYAESVGWFESCRAIFTYDFAWRGAALRGLANAAWAAGDSAPAEGAAQRAKRLGY